jgi:uncharacterized protein YjbJ (UPF0337 family)
MLPGKTLGTASSRDRGKHFSLVKRVVCPVHTSSATGRQKGDQMMKPSSEDQIKGALHEVKGAVKEKAGQVTNNPDLEAEGQAEKIAGKVQKKVGQIEKVFEK